MRPVAVCGQIDDQWQSYRSGVIPNCNGANPGGHCVLAVGVFSDGTSNVATNYWKFKNSWGIGYGLKGYVQAYRDPADTSLGICGLCGGMYAV
jgi:C1A family cysteine protease